MSKSEISNKGARLECYKVGALLNEDCKWMSKLRWSIIKILDWSVETLGSNELGHQTRVLRC